MEKLEFKNCGLEELSQKELQETDGGFFWLAVALAGGTITAAGYGLYAMAEAGYNQA